MPIRRPAHGLLAAATLVAAFAVTAGPDGLEFLTIGAPLEGTPYRPPDWG